jgi:hypothetical protein
MVIHIMIKCHEIPTSWEQEYARVEREPGGSKSGSAIANPANLRSARSEMLISDFHFEVASLTLDCISSFQSMSYFFFYP